MEKAEKIIFIAQILTGLFAKIAEGTAMVRDIDNVSVEQLQEWAGKTGADRDAALAKLDAALADGEAG